MVKSLGLQYMIISLEHLPRLSYAQDTIIPGEMQNKRINITPQKKTYFVILTSL